MSKLFIEPGSSLKNHVGSWATQHPVMKNKWPPCGQTCPSTEDIQAWLALASDEKWQAAWRKLTERNPFPAVMGRVCYHPCESACNRTHLDSAVNIHSMERYLGDLALKEGWQHKKLTSEPLNDNLQSQMQPKKIAIVGAGPAGLSCAYQLALRGFEVTVFDSAATAGGTLNAGIPDYRLPKKILAQEVSAIVALGIKLVLNCHIGRDITEETLLADYDALFLAVGAQKPRLYQDKKYASQTVMSGIDFLAQVNTNKQINLPSNVVVIGGGNTAIDVARCVIRMGSQVTIVCAQYPHSARIGQPGAEIPASLLEVGQAEAEGVEIIYRSGVSRLVYSADHLSGVEISRVDKIHDRHGHFNPALFEGTEEFLSTGLVVFAIGQEVDWQGLLSVKAPETSGVFIGGDAGGEARLAPAAVGSGFQGAMKIIKYLTEKMPEFKVHKKAEVTYKNLNFPYYLQTERNEEKTEIANEITHKKNESVLSFTEINDGFDLTQAKNEAERCLSCGVCFQCDNCWHFCPDAAVVKYNEKYKIDYDYCKGCGICANECPSGFIKMAGVQI